MPRASTRGLISLAALAVLLLVATACAEVEWIQGDEAKALELARAEEKLVLVDIWADWCTWCKELDKEVFPSDEFAKAAESFVLLKVDSDANEGYLEKTGQDGLPTTAFLTPDGEVLCAVAGYMPTAEYIAMLDDAKLVRASQDADIAGLDEGQRDALLAAYDRFGMAEQGIAIVTVLEAGVDPNSQQAAEYKIQRANLHFQANQAEEGGKVLADLLGIPSVDEAELDADVLKNLYIGVGYDVVPPPPGLPVAATVAEGATGILIVSGSEDGVAALLELRDALAPTKGALPAAGELSPEEALALGEGLMSLILYAEAVPYLEAGGAAGKVRAVMARAAGTDPAEALTAVNAALAAEGLAPGDLAMLKTAKAVATLRSGPDNTGFAATLLAEALEGLPEDAPERAGIEILANENVLRAFSE